MHIKRHAFTCGLVVIPAPPESSFTYFGDLDIPVTFYSDKYLSLIVTLHSHPRERWRIESFNHKRKLQVHFCGTLECCLEQLEKIAHKMYEMGINIDEPENYNLRQEYKRIHRYLIAWEKKL